jgi:hypothetical protein
MKPKFLPLLETCLSNGLHIGYSRAHKHNDAPNSLQIIEEQQAAIMNEFFENFDFPPVNEYLRMVQKGAKAWEGVDDDWLETLRGGKDEA